MKLSFSTLGTVLLLLLVPYFLVDAFSPPRLTSFGHSSRSLNGVIQNEGSGYLQYSRLNTNLRAEPRRNVWVKYEDDQAAEVNAAKCRNVDGFKKLVKKRLGLSSPLRRIVLCTSSEAEDGSVALTALDPWAPVPVQQFKRDGSPVPLIVQVWGSQNRVKIQWITENMTSPVHTYDPASKYFELGSDYLTGSSMTPHGSLDGKTILYCRDDFHRQFKFLQKRVMEDSCIGWVIGSPGSGKSLTTLAFVSTVDRSQWFVTWIRLEEFGSPLCMHFDRASKKFLRMAETDVLQVLDDVSETKNHIAIIDGYMHSEEHKLFLKHCKAWVRNNRKRRRLVVVSVMSPHGKKILESDRHNNVEGLFVSSWTLEEYLLAIKHDEFFKIVESKLDSTAVIQIPGTVVKRPSPNDRVKSKYYFAGGNVGYMFQLWNEYVIRDLSAAMFKAGDDIVPYIKGTVTEDHWDEPTEHLISSYIESSDMSKTSDITTIVSAWAATSLAMRTGQNLVKGLANVVDKASNPSMFGCLLEMWFYACIRICGVKVRDASGVKCENWPACAVHRLLEPTLPKVAVWMKPVTRNEGGYDTIFVNKRKHLVRFVQFTTESTRSFKIEYFFMFLQQLKRCQPSFDIKTLEIVFLVPELKIGSFKLYPVSGQGLLSAYPGWEEGEEESKVRKLSVERWDGTF